MTDMRKQRVAVVTTTRADYGILRPLLRKLNEDPAFDLQLVVTGTHFSVKHGSTVSQIFDDGFPVSDLLDVGLDDSSPFLLARACGRLTECFGTFLEKKLPDIVIVLGDRFELLSIAQAATLFGVPLAHIHGGETTEGALDDSVRHALTKLSHVHFVAAPEFADVIIAMGEDPAKVHVVGSLGVEQLLASAAEPPPSFISAVAGPGENYVVVTVHPETRGTNEPGAIALAVTSALDLHPDLGVIVTAPNSDPGADEIAYHLQKWAEARDRTLYVPSLGPDFAPTLKGALMIIGNSSSGIIEAPALGVPTVNVGTRQEGRPFATSVVTVGATRTEVCDAILDFRVSNPVLGSLPYGTGCASTNIVELLRAVNTPLLLIKRHVPPPS